MLHASACNMVPYHLTLRPWSEARSTFTRSRGTRRRMACCRGSSRGRGPRRRQHGTVAVAASPVPGDAAPPPRNPGTRGSSAAVVNSLAEPGCILLPPVPASGRAPGTRTMLQALRFLSRRRARAFGPCPSPTVRVVTGKGSSSSSHPAKAGCSSSSISLALVRGSRRPPCLVSD